MSVLDPNPGIGIHSKHVARVRLRYSLFPAYLYVCRRISLSFSRDYSDSRLIISVESESSLVRLVDEFQPPLGLPRLASVVQRERACKRSASSDLPCRLALSASVNNWPASFRSRSVSHIHRLGSLRLASRR